MSVTVRLEIDTTSDLTVTTVSLEATVNSRHHEYLYAALKPAALLTITVVVASEMHFNALCTLM